MILVYVDESGNRGTAKLDGHEWLYTVTAVTLFNQSWHPFEKTLNRHKKALIQRIKVRDGVRLELADCEVKSTAVRIPKLRRAHPFLGRLTEAELLELVSLFYQRLELHNMHVFSVLVDKRCLPEYMDPEKLHRKCWELLLERIELFMRARNWKHQAMMICDDSNKQANRSLAMKHAFLMDEGTKSSLWLRHLCEMPMFVRSELSNGVQLADLCSYNIYRAFSRDDLGYEFFRRIAPAIWCPSTEVKKGAPFSGLYVFPANSPLRDQVATFEKERASDAMSEALKVESSGANPIEPACGTGRAPDKVSGAERLEGERRQVKREHL